MKRYFQRGEEKKRGYQHFLTTTLYHTRMSLGMIWAIVTNRTVLAKYDPDELLCDPELLSLKSWVPRYKHVRARLKEDLLIEYDDTLLEDDLVRLQNESQPPNNHKPKYVWKNPEKYKDKRLVLFPNDMPDQIDILWSPGYEQRQYEISSALFPNSTSTLFANSTLDRLYRQGDDFLYGMLWDRLLSLNASLLPGNLSITSSPVPTFTMGVDLAAADTMNDGGNLSTEVISCISSLLQPLQTKVKAGFSDTGRKRDDRSPKIPCHVFLGLTLEKANGVYLQKLSQYFDEEYNCSVVWPSQLDCKADGEVAESSSLGLLETSFAWLYSNLHVLSRYVRSAMVLPSSSDSMERTKIPNNNRYPNLSKLPLANADYRRQMEWWKAGRDPPLMDYQNDMQTCFYKDAKR